MQGGTEEHPRVSGSLSNGGLSDANEVPPRHAALQVSVRLESVKASLILKNGATSRRGGQLCL